MNALKPSSPALNRMDFARLRKPSPLPLRPLEPNRFRPPRGEKQVFLCVHLPIAADLSHI